MKSYTIKDWSDDDKPREKLLSKGISALSNTVLISILIGSGTRNLSAVELAKSILLASENNLNNLGKKSVADLTKLKGIGPAKAITIISALELGRRQKLDQVKDKTKITSSKDVFNIFQPVIGEISHEEFWVILLNRNNKILKKINISKGGLSSTVIDVRIILKHALDELASAIILCHNHPSGNTEPSQEDKRITSKIKTAAESMDISLLDHIIVTHTNHFSFADEGIL